MGKSGLEGLGGLLVVERGYLFLSRSSSLIL
jgi:hypothetical protein